MIMDLQTYLDNAVKAERARKMAESDQLTLGEIISKCEAIAERGYRTSDGNEPWVVFDFEHAQPKDVGSWRGSYEELAIRFTFDKTHEIRLSEFIKMMKDAVGATFDGYKGGNFKMSRHTPVWVANYGNSGNTAVVEVVDNNSQVILMTGWREL